MDKHIVGEIPTSHWRCLRKEDVMKPLYFKQHNKVYAKDQKPYLPLPVYEDDMQGGRVFHCWALSWIERLKILFTGKLWINVLRFKQPLQPIKPMVDNPFK